MRSIRRLYFYLVAFISLEVVIWGLINLLRTIFAGKTLFPGADTLAQALALILVGVPLFAFHWLWAQRAAFRDEEEHAATLRAVFLYAALLATLIPVVQNTLALFDRLLISGAQLEVSRSILGSTQTWQDNLIAIVLNGIAAAYFFNVLRMDWRSLKERENFADVRRLYRYIWVLYGLLMTVFGVQQVLSFLFYTPSAIIGESGREVLVNGLALIIVGAPIWAYAWSVCQQALDEPMEQGSMLRLGVLYLLALAAVVTVLTSAGIIVDILLRLALGESMDLREFLLQMRNPVSIGIPLAGIWAYYGSWLGKDIDSVSDPARRSGLKRFYFYILSLIGLAATFIGLALLLSFVIDVLVNSEALWGENMRPRLAGAIATLSVGLPVWLLTWRPMQVEALAAGEAGDHARRSLVRKVYLYLVIFAAVIGGMVSGVILVYQLLSALLSGTLPDDFIPALLNTLQVLVLFIAFLLYHLSALRRDGGQAADSLAVRHSKFPVLVFEKEGSGFAALVYTAVQKIAAGIPLAVQAVEHGIPAEANNTRAVVLPSSLALDPPEALRLWLKEYPGQKIIVPVEDKGWLWSGGTPRHAALLAAQFIRQLADGQEVRAPSGTAAWQVVAYIFAALFAIQLAFGLLVFGISLLFGG
jgi:hypothetical protein